MIIALGEVVVAIGIAVVDSLTEATGLPADTLIALTTAGVLVGLLWWSYFDRGGIALAAFRAYRVVAKERLVVVAAIALVALLGRDWDGVVFLVAVDVVIFLGLVAEHLRIESPTPAAA